MSETAYYSQEHHYDEDVQAASHEEALQKAVQVIERAEHVSGQQLLEVRVRPVPSLSPDTYVVKVETGTREPERLPVFAVGAKA